MTHCKALLKEHWPKSRTEFETWFAPNSYVIFLFAYSTLLLVGKKKRDDSLYYFGRLTFWVSDYLPAKYGTQLLRILIKNMHVINFKFIDHFLMTEVKKPLASVGDTGSIPGLRRSPGEENGNPLQHSCLRNPMDRGAWQATVQGVAMIWTLLSDWIATQIKHYHSKR